MFANFHFCNWFLKRQADQKATSLRTPGLEYYLALENNLHHHTSEEFATIECWQMSHEINVNVAPTLMVPRRFYVMWKMTVGFVFARRSCVIKKWHNLYSFSEKVYYLLFSSKQ